MEKVQHVQSLEEAIMSFAKDIKEGNNEPRYICPYWLITVILEKGFCIMSHDGRVNRDGTLEIGVRLLEPRSKSEAEVLMLKYV